VFYKKKKDYYSLISIIRIFFEYVLGSNDMGTIKSSPLIWVDDLFGEFKV